VGSPFYYGHHRFGTLTFCASHWKHTKLSSGSWTQVKNFAIIFAMPHVDDNVSLNACFEMDYNNFALQELSLKLEQKIICFFKVS